jgi:hypothetical protein
MNTTKELYDFAENYVNYPDLASNIAVDAEEKGEPEIVVNFFEALGDVYLEDKEQAKGMIEQLNDDMPAM